jgi:outer membrane protein assembly factor BamB
MRHSSTRLGSTSSTSILAASVALLAACTGASPEPAPGGVDGSAPPSAAAPATLDGPPAGVERVGTGSGRAVLTDDLLFALSWTGAKCILVAKSLTALDAERWRVSEVDGKQLGCTDGAPAVAGTSLILPYGSATAGTGIEAGSSEEGIIALGPDGTRRWHTAIKGVNTVIGANDRFALVADGRKSLPGSDEQHVTAVLDIESGRVLWQRAGLNARGIDGDTVIVTDEQVTNVTALDAATGNQRWTTPMYALGRLGLTGTGVVAVPLKEKPNDLVGFGAKTALRDTATGKVLHTEPGTAASVDCVSDGKTAVVCQTFGAPVENRSVFAFDMAARKRSWTIPAKQVADAKIEVRSMIDGRVLFSTASGAALVDALTGKQLAVGLTEAPETIRGAYGVANEAAKSYTVVRLTS